LATKEQKMTATNTTNSIDLKELKNIKKLLNARNKIILLQVLQKYL